MAHFYGSIRGRAGEGTRVGTKRSGMHGHVRGWNVGVAFDLSHDEKTGKDRVRVYRTGGSTHSGRRELIAEFTEGDQP